MPPASKRFSLDCFPNPEQTLLLRAALCPEQDAIAAWQEWRSRYELDAIDYGSFRLLPMLYKRLSDLGYKDPLLTKLKGLYRFSWVKNSRMLRLAAPVLESFDKAGIPTMLMKGASLALFVYQDYAIRFMDDFDLLVPFEQAPHAIELLQQWGWKADPRLAKVFKPSGHAAGFTDSRGLGLDLHWHLLHACCSTGDDKVFWQGARKVTAEGAPTYILNPCDQLICICLHGVRWSGVPTIRWVADAVWLLKTHGAEIDWNRLVTIAQDLRLSISLRETLTYLKECFQAPIPDKTLEELGSIPTKKWERREFVSEASERRWLDEFPVLWHRYHRSAYAKIHRLKPLGFFHYLREYCGLEKSREVPGFLWKRFAPRLRGNISQKPPSKAGAFGPSPIKEDL